VENDLSYKVFSIGHNALGYTIFSIIHFISHFKQLGLISDKYFWFIIFIGGLCGNFPFIKKGKKKILRIQWVISNSQPQPFYPK
jgi:hypothetical protein